MLTNGDSVLQLEVIKSPLQMQVIFYTLCQILTLKDLSNLLCRSLCHQIIFDVLVKQDMMTTHSIRFILFQSFSEVSINFSCKISVSFKFYAFNASITSHLHIPKSFVLSNFVKSIFDWWMFTVDWLIPAICSRIH